VVFPEGDNEKILRACHTLLEEKIATPILLGDVAKILAKTLELGLNLRGAEIVDPLTARYRERYIQELFRLRQRSGVTLDEARTLINDRNIFASMMVHMGDTDALVSGVTQHFPDTIRPALQIVRMREGLHKVAGCYPMIQPTGIYFFWPIRASTSILRRRILSKSLCARRKRRDALTSCREWRCLSFSSFGSSKHKFMREGTQSGRTGCTKADPSLIVDGEIMADAAVSPEILEQTYPFSSLQGGANVLVFPDLASANIACKLLGNHRRLRELWGRF